MRRVLRVPMAPFAAPQWHRVLPRFAASPALSKSEQARAQKAEDVGNALCMMVSNHKHTATPNEQRRIEALAWKEISELPDDDIDVASHEAVRMINKGWAYFARHWENGPDGPGEEAGFGGNDAFPPVAYDFHDTKGRVELRPGTGDLSYRRADPQEEKPVADPLMMTLE